MTVQYATSDGTATALDDYAATSTTATIPASQTSTSVQIPIVDDSLDEPNETFSVVLSSPSAGAQISGSNGTATVTIIDNDVVAATTTTPPVLSIADVTVDEDAGNAVLIISIDNPTSTSVTVQYATSDGTATSPDDYGATSTTATIPASQTSTSVQIPIVDDSLDEPNETFSVVLSSPSAGAQISGSNGTATVTIIDNDPAPSPIPAVST